MLLDKQIVELVTKEYPTSNEQASVLTSKIWYLVEKEIRKNIESSDNVQDVRSEITKVASLFDTAAEELQKLNRPVIRKGGVSEYYSAELVN